MATLAEIAKIAGVTPKTVSNILNRQIPEKRPSAVRRAAVVREIATKLHYRPNTAARAIVTGRFNAVGLLLSDDIRRGCLFTGTRVACAKALSDKNMHLILGQVSDEQLSSEGYVPPIMREWSVDGLLVNYVDAIPPRMLDLVQQHGAPEVWVNGRLTANCVYADDQAATRRAVDSLVALGHRRIAYVNYECSGHYSATDRRNGYETGMMAAGLTPRVIEEAIGPSEWQERSMQWLRGADRPTAIIAYDADRAIPIYCAALRSGLSVPKDLSMVTFHEFPVQTIGLPMSTFRVPAREIGDAAVAMLLERIAHNGHNVAPRAVPLELVDGMTAPPSGK